MHSWKKLHYASTLRIVKNRLTYAGFKPIRITGFNWIPVSRTSNIKLIPFFAFLERLFHLYLLVDLSLWLLVEARKL